MCNSFRVCPCYCTQSRHAGLSQSTYINIDLLARQHVRPACWLVAKPVPFNSTPDYCRRFQTAMVAARQRSKPGNRSSTPPGLPTGATPVKGEQQIMSAMMTAMQQGGMPPSTAFLTPAHRADIQATGKRIDDIYEQVRLSPEVQNGDPSAWHAIPPAAANQLAQLLTGVLQRVLGMNVQVDMNNEEYIEEMRAAGKQLPAEMDPLFPRKDSAASPGAAASSSTAASSSRGATSPSTSAQGAAAAMAGLSLGTTSGSSSSASGGSGSRSGCRVCGATTRQDGKTKLLQCSRCKDKGCLYCSAACQKQDWPRHKQTCVPAASS